MVDWDGLENRCARESTVGSNPTLSSMSPSRALQISSKILAFTRNNALLVSRAVPPNSPASNRCWGILGVGVSPIGGTMALTDIQAKTAKPAEKPYKLADAHGLYLHVAVSGLRVDFH